MEMTVEDEQTTSAYGPVVCSLHTAKLLNSDSLTIENPAMLISKEILIQDIEENPESSDFSVYKDSIMNYPEGTMLFVLDYDSKYGEGYYLCLTVQAKEAVNRQLGDMSIQESELNGETSASEKEKKSLLKDAVGHRVSKISKVQFSLCTEKEVDEEKVEDTEPKARILVTINKEIERKPLRLSMKTPTVFKELYVEILPEVEYFDEAPDEEKLEPIYCKTADCGIQVTTLQSTNCTQTFKSKMANAWTQCELKVFTEKEKRNILKTTKIKRLLQSIEKRISLALIENRCIVDLDRHWSVCGGKDFVISAGKEASLIETQSFACVRQTESKMITSIDWHPDNNGILLASTLQNCTFEEQVNKFSSLLLEPCMLYIWSIEDQILPRLLLDGCDEVLSVQFNPTMAMLIAGGCIHGQLVLWDLTLYEEKLKSPVEYNWIRDATPYNVGALGAAATSFKSPIARYCASSNIDYSHAQGVHHLQWVPAFIEILPKGEIVTNQSLNSFQIITCGFDGTFRFWDIRNVQEGHGNSQKFNHSNLDSPYSNLDMNWKPFHTIEIPPSEGQKCLCITTFSLKVEKTEPNLSDLEFVDEQSEMKEKQPSYSIIIFAGTEDGKVFRHEFKSDKSEEVGKSLPPELQYYTSAHSVHMHGGPVVKIAISPFMSDTFFSAGARTMAIWRNDLPKGPLFLKISKFGNISACQWSPTRPAVFTVGLDDGSIRVWDLLENSREPVLIQSVSAAGITTIETNKVSQDQQVQAIGDRDGFVHILTLPKYLWEPVENELVLSRQFLDRESRRVQVQAEKQAKIDAQRAAAAKLEEEKKKKKEKPAEPIAEAIEEKSEKEKENELLLSEYKIFLDLEEKCLIELGYIIKTEESELVNEDDDS